MINMEIDSQVIPYIITTSLTAIWDIGMVSIHI